MNYRLRRMKDERDANSQGGIPVSEEHRLARRATTTENHSNYEKHHSNR